MAFGGTEILARLSTGGMGEVLLGRRTTEIGFEKLCALKTIRGDLTSREDFRVMFLDEAKLVARLDHPAICQVFDFGEEGRSLYLAMEYIPGVPLAQLLKAGRAPFPPDVAAIMIAEVLRGLHHAHEVTDTAGHPLGVVHRDVSPQNLILTFEGRMKILDFGIALTKDRETPETAVGVLKGKPSYMAPEHLRGQAVDRRADIFSAAVVLHELLTGQKLFTRDTALATALAVESDVVAPPSSYVTDISAELDAIVLRGLARNPDDRFDDARQMAEALERAVGMPGTAIVEAFARRELAVEAEQHQAWLIEVLDRAEREGALDVDAILPATPASVVEGDLPGPPPEARPSSGAPPRRTSGSPGPRRPSDAPSDPRRSSVAAAELRRNTWPSPFSTDAVTEVGRVLRERPPVALGLAAVALVAVLGAVFAFGSDAPPEATPLAAEVEVPATVTPTVAASPSPSIAASPTPSASPAAARRRPRDGEGAEPRESPRPSESPREREAGRDAPRTRPHAEASGEPAYLTIGATPYANVRIDGVDVGVTPIMRRKVSAGTHKVELLSPENGEVRLERSVHLEANQHERVTVP
jgi:serine/threonine-protein kinase